MNNENKDVKVILGLDVSTSTIGMSLALYNDDKLELIDVTHLKLKIPNKIKGISALFMKNELFLNKLKEYKNYPIDTVVIEEPLFSSNNSNTVVTLLRFNTLISKQIYDELGIIPEYISSYDAREYGMPQLMAIRKFNKKGEPYDYKKIKSDLKHNKLVLFGDYDWDIEKKDVIWNYVSEIYPQINWVYDKNGNLSKENFDASDSLICIIGYISKMKYGDSEAKIVSYEEIDDKNGKLIKYVVNFCGKLFENRIELIDNKPIKTDILVNEIKSENVNNS